MSSHSVQNKYDDGDEQEESTTSTTDCGGTQVVEKTKKKKKKKKLEVSFGDVDIIQFPLVLGDNPAVSEGPPLTFGWKPVDRESVGIGYYEFVRGSTRRRNLLIPAVERELYLLSIGYDLNDLLKATEKIRKIKKDRLSSFQNKKWDSFKCVMETAKQKLMGVPNIQVSKSA